MWAQWHSMPDLQISTGIRALSLFGKKGGMKKISEGFNHVRGGTTDTVHAERDAVIRLPFRARNKALKKVDVLVIRSGGGINRLGMSRPCSRCCIELARLPTKRRYRVKRIFFSGPDGSIVSLKMSEL